MTYSKESIDWSDEYSIGHEKIDHQHQQLFRLLQKLHQVYKQGATQQIIAKAIEALVRYTQSHFSEEERVMEEIAYPQYAEHRKLHDELIQQAENLLEEVESGEIVLIDELLIFLKDWLINHILQEDFAISAYIRQRNAA